MIAPHSSIRHIQWAPFAHNPEQTEEYSTHCDGTRLGSDGEGRVGEKIMVHDGLVSNISVPPNCKSVPTHIAYNILTTTKTNQVFMFTLQPFLFMRDESPNDGNFDATIGQNTEDNKNKQYHKFLILPNLAYKLTPSFSPLQTPSDTIQVFKPIDTQHIQGIASCVYLPGFCPLASLPQSITHTSNDAEIFNNSIKSSQVSPVNTYTSPNTYCDLYQHSIALFTYSLVSRLPAFITPVGSFILSGLEGGTSIIPLYRKIHGKRSIYWKKPSYFFSTENIQSEYYHNEYQKQLIDKFDSKNNNHNNSNNNNNNNNNNDSPRKKFRIPFNPTSYICNPNKILPLFSTAC